MDFSLDAMEARSLIQVALFDSEMGPLQANKRLKDKALRRKGGFVEQDPGNSYDISIS
jgi:hypothetical protein